jgi:hypothetical protein
METAKTQQELQLQHWTAKAVPAAAQWYWVWIGWDGGAMLQLGAVLVSSIKLESMNLWL